MVNITPEGVLIAVGWAVSLSMAILIYRKSRQIKADLNEIWNAKVELKDLNGEVIKVPITEQKGTDKDGEPVFETKMVVAPLWYTIMYAAGNIAVQHFQQWFNNQKSHLSKRLQKGALEAAGEGGDLGDFMAFLPKKAQTALALIQAAKGLQKRGGGQTGGGGQQI